MYICCLTTGIMQDSLFLEGVCRCLSIENGPCRRKVAVFAVHLSNLCRTAEKDGPLDKKQYVVQRHQKETPDISETKGVQSINNAPYVCIDLLEPGLSASSRRRHGIDHWWLGRPVRRYLRAGNGVEIGPNRLKCWFGGFPYRNPCDFNHR